MKIIYMLVGGVVCFFVFTSVWVFISVLFPQEIHSEVTPGDYEDVRLETEDGLSLAGWLITNQSYSQSDGDKAIILAHGYPADKGDILPLTEFLAEEYDLLYFDFRGLGESEGSYSSVGIHERRDLRAAISWLESQGYDQIGLWGFSVGGATALMEAPQAESVEAVVAVASYAQLADLSEQLFRFPYVDSWLAEFVRGYAYLVFGEDLRAISPEIAVTDYEKPVYIIHPRNDQVVPLEHGERLEAALSDNPEAETWFPAGSHGIIEPIEHRQRVRNFFARHL